jgi:hypothetical protein
MLGQGPVNADEKRPTYVLRHLHPAHVMLRKIQLQDIEDFYWEILEKGQILNKPDQEVMLKFIKGLPEKLAFYVRNVEKDSTSLRNLAPFSLGYPENFLQVPNFSILYLTIVL